MTAPIDSSQTLLTTLEAAQFLRLSVRTLEGYRNDATGPRYYKLGPGRRAKVVYRPIDLTAWVDKHGHDPKA